MRGKVIAITALWIVVLGAAGAAVLLREPRLSRGERSAISSGSRSAATLQLSGSILRSATDPGSDAATSSSASALLAASGFNCAGASSGFSCYEKYYRHLVDTKGIDAVFSDLKARYARDPYAAAQCHPLTHVIGKEAAGRFANIADAYLHGSSFCWSGYYHGILEGVIAKIGLRSLPSRLDTICAGIRGKERYSFDYYNCVHGVGHGIMDLQSDDVPASLSMCDNLSGDFERQSCYGGVFMENIISFDKEGEAPYLKKSDPLYPCTIVADTYKGQCYLGQTSFVLRQNGYDFAKGFAACAAVAEPYRDICNQSMGRDAAGSTNDDPARAKNNCWIAADPNDRKNCVIGAVKDMISYFHDTKQAFAFCGLLDADNKNVCTDTAHTYFAAF